MVSQLQRFLDDPSGKPRFTPPKNKKHPKKHDPTPHQQNKCVHYSSPPQDEAREESEQVEKLKRDTQKKLKKHERDASNLSYKSEGMKRRVGGIERVCNIRGHIVIQLIQGFKDSRGEKTSKMTHIRLIHFCGSADFFLTRLNIPTLRSTVG